MSAFFSKLQAICESEKKKNDFDTAPAKDKISNYKKVSGWNWWFGGLCILSLLLLLTALVFDVKQTRQNMGRMEMTTRMQMEYQRLPATVQLASSGYKKSFVQLRNIQKKINHHIKVLSQGGLFHQSQLTPVTRMTQRAFLEELTKHWRLEEKKINLILNNQKLFISLGELMNDINSTTTELLRKTDQLMRRMAQIESSPHELGTIATMQTLTRNAARSINVMLASNLPVVEIQAQLEHDRKQLSAVIQTLNQEQNRFKLFVIKDPQVQKILHGIESLFEAADSKINTIQAQISAAKTIKLVINALMQNNETMQSKTVALYNLLKADYAERTDLLIKTRYVLISCIVLLTFVCIYLLLQNNIIQALFGKNKLKNNAQGTMSHARSDMRKIAEGDHTARTKVTQDVIGTIGDAINGTITELHALAKQVDKASVQVFSASIQAHHISTRLLSAAQHQTCQIEETTVAVLKMTESINTVSDTAAESTQVARQLLATVENGGITVREAIAATNEFRAYIQETSKRIKRLGESAQEISEIATLVSDITEQTNVLALNARLQTTTAGDTGNNFSVIAQELERLAEQSNEASKQSSRLIKIIQKDTYDAITAMEKSTLKIINNTQKTRAAGKALEEIESLSKHLALCVYTIYDTSHAQTHAASKVIENMEHILLITRTTRYGARQTTASIKQISGFASALKTAASSFKI